MEGVVESKPSCPHEGNELKNPTDGNKWQASNTNKYIINKLWNKPIPDPEYGDDFKGRYTDL